MINCTLTPFDVYYTLKVSLEINNVLNATNQVELVYLDAQKLSIQVWEEVVVEEAAK